MQDVTRLDQGSFSEFEKQNYRSIIIVSLGLIITITIFFLIINIPFEMLDSIVIARIAFFVMTSALLFYFIYSFENLNMNTFSILFYLILSSIVFTSLATMPATYTLNLTLEIILSLHIYFILPVSLKYKLIGSGILMTAIFVNVPYLSLRHPVNFYILIFLITNSVGIAASVVIRSYRFKLFQLMVEKETFLNLIESTSEEIKELKGLIPICSKCKKIRDDEGYWEKMNIFLEKNTYTKFADVICESCTQKRRNNEH